MLASSNACFYFNPAISHPNTHSQPQLEIQDNAMFFMHQQYLNESVLVPPCFHSQSSNYAFTPVEEMTVDQTKKWIWSLGSSYGWQQKEEYAVSFEKNNIHGKLLQHLKDDMLRTDLNIGDQTHRRELLSAIDNLYPYTRLERADQTSEYYIGNPFTPCRSSMKSKRESNNLPPYSVCSISFDEPIQMDSRKVMSQSGVSQRSIAVSETMSIQSSFSSNTRMSSVRREKDNNDNVVNVDTKDKNYVMSAKKPMEDSQTEMPRKIFMPSKSRKLRLTHEAHQVVRNECPIKSIRRRFQQKLNIDVEVQKMWDKPNTYILVFAKCEQVSEVLQSKEIGYKLKKWWPSRASPQSPKLYIALDDLVVRAGKKPCWKILFTLAMGSVVLVNQVKGRRARLCNCKGVPIGWVSLHDESGKTLLTRLGDF